MTFVKKIRKDTNNDTGSKPQGIGKATKEPLKFGSLEEAKIVIMKLRSRTEKRQAWKFILDIAKSGSKSEKIYANSFIAGEAIKNKFISKSQKLDAVEKLGELKAEGALVALTRYACEEVVANAAMVKLVKLKAVDTFGELKPPDYVLEKVAKDAMKEFVKLTRVDTWKELGNPELVVEKVARVIGNEFRRLKNKIVNDEIQKLIDEFNIPETEKNSNGNNIELSNIKPKKKEKAFEKLLKIGSFQEAMDVINKLGSRTEKEKTWKFILDIAKSGSNGEKIYANVFIAKQDIENKFISKSQKLDAVEKLGELKAEGALLYLALDASDEVVKKVVKELGKLNAVGILSFLQTFPSEGVFKDLADTELKILEKDWKK